MPGIKDYLMEMDDRFAEHRRVCLEEYRTASEALLHSAGYGAGAGALAGYALAGRPVAGMLIGAATSLTIWAADTAITHFSGTAPLTAAKKIKQIQKLITQ